MIYLKDDCIFKLINESEKRHAKASKKNDEKGMEREDAYQEALYDVLDWVNENTKTVEVIGGELEMVAV
jgi:hypothetical protein